MIIRQFRGASFEFFRLNNKASVGSGLRAPVVAHSGIVIALKDEHNPALAAEVETFLMMNKLCEQRLRFSALPAFWPLVGSKPPGKPAELVLCRYLGRCFGSDTNVRQKISHANNT